MLYEKYQTELEELSNYCWEHPEPSFREYKCSGAQVDFLRMRGFEVTTDVAGTTTGYMAQWGEGRPVIALLGEFDALYGLQQQADVARETPIDGQTMGQGCGHHLLGVGAIAAGLILRDIMTEKGYKGTIRIYGCPAEESGSGKAYMARDGVFDDCDVALTWHPALYNMVATGSSQSCIQCYFRFYGVASHAAAAPHLGRSALDAVELMNVGVNYLREHMEDSDRVHYSITNAGSMSPNVVQAFAESRYLIRSTTNPKCERLFERVINIAKGAALMTETRLEVVFDEGLSNTIPNFALETVADEVFREIGVPVYTPAEREYAKGFKETFSLNDMLTDIPYTTADKDRLRRSMAESELNDYYIETIHSDRCEMGSTDVGDVSWVVPTCTINTNCYAYGAGAHSWQWVAQGKSPIALKGMLHAGEALALTAQKLIERPEVITQARQELDGRLGGEHYKCLIPADIKPHYFD